MAAVAREFIMFSGMGAIFVRRSTPQERAVLLFAGIFLLVAVGLLCLYFGFTAPADKAEEAAALRMRGYASIAGGFALWGIYRIASWVLDRLL